MKKHVVKNKVGLALRERISRAHKNGEEFFVMVMIPLMPAFEGDVLDTISAVLRIQIGYYQASISRGENSLFQLLVADGVEDPHKYIKFFSLRGHCQMPKTNVPMSEMIYIHSKLMIVDDLYIICGSANLNDRSMLGSRDHETAVIMTQLDQTELVNIKMNGKTVKASKMAHSLRT